MSFVQSERFRWLLTAIFIILLALIVLQFPHIRARNDATVLLTNATAEVVEPTATAVSIPTPEPLIAVDLIGAVQQPGVYYLSRSARVVDAVDAAGGLAPDADRERINLAQAVEDGTQIRVPRVGEQQAAQAAPDQPVALQPRLININTADQAMLETLPGVGPVTAQAIINYRLTQGEFRQIDDIQNVKGIGPSTFGKLQEHITVGP